CRKGAGERLSRLGHLPAQIPVPRLRRLLWARGGRPRRRRPAEQRDELAPPLSITSSASESSLCMCCSPSFAWTHSLTHRRCWPIFLLDVQKLQRCVPNVGDLMPRDRGSVYVAAGTNLDIPCALLVLHLRLASA